MATPTTPASTSAAPAPQGTIVFVQGEAYLRDRQGKLQAIKPGDAVAEGQEIVTTAGALVDVQLPSGAKLSIGPDRQVLLNDELFATAAPEPTENVVSSLGADADKVIQALNTGGDPFAGLEDPAAGVTGGGNSDQTHNFVRLVRILEDVTPLAFNYTSSSDGIDFLPVSSVPAQPTTTAANQPPVATDDPAFTTREDEATTVTVLTNDSDPDGDPISVTRATAPNGTVTLNPDGTLRYVPNPDFNGTDTITYTISDGKGGTATATVTVNVTPVNDPPVARPDSATTNEDTPITFPVLGNDSDPESDPLTVTGATVDPAQGSVVVNPDGTLRFTPAPNFNGPAQITYTIDDGKGGTTTATVTVNVTPVNDPPVARPDSATTNEDTPVTFPVLGNDSDPEGDPLTVTGATVDPAQGSVVVNPDGTLRFTPAPNFNGPAQITYTIDDGKGGTATAVVTVNVAPVNDAPVARDDSGRVEEDATLVVNLDNGLIASALDPSGKDTDIEGDPLTVTALRTGTEAGSGTAGTVGSPLLGTYGSLTVYPQGSYTYVADRATALAAGKTATDTFTYTISDGKGGTDTAELVITITGTNDAPVQVGTLPGVNGTDAQPVTISTAAAFADPDTGDTLTFSAAGLPPGLSIDPASGLITGTLASDASVRGAYPITVTVTDGSGAQTSQAFTLSVGNPAPTANPDVLSVTENDTQGGNVLTGSGLGGDKADIDPDGDALVVTRVGTGSTPDTDVTPTGTVIAGLHGNLTLKADGSYTYTATDDRLAAGATATDTFAYTISDAQGGTSTTTLTVTVTGTNDGAVITGPDLGTVTEDATLSASGQLLATDVDSPAQFTAAIAPGAYGNFSIDAAGNWTYTLNNSDPAVQALGTNDVRIEQFTVNTNDGSTHIVTINVNGANEAPTAVDASATGAEDAASIPVTLGGGDVDGTVVSFSLANLPTNGALYLDAAMTKPVLPGTPLPATSGAASLYFKPNANWNGNTSFQFSATDGEGASSPLATVTIEVTAVNDNPIAADNRGAVREDGTLNAIPSNGLIASALDPSGKDTDIEGDPLTVTALRTGTEAGSGTAGTVGSPLLGTYGSLTVDPQGSYTYVADRATALAAGKTATDTFTYTISDGKGGTDTAELVITVTGTNDAPVQVGALPGVNGTDAQPVTIPTAAGFADPDTGDILTFSATGLPPGLSIDPASGLITGTLASDASVRGAYPITVTVTDGSGAQTSQAFTLSVGNPAPIASPDALSVTENDTQGGNVLTGSGLGGDKADIDPDGDALVVTRVGTGSTPDTDVTPTGTVIAGLHGNLTLKADGSYTYTATDDRLAAGATATDTFTYTISDAQGGTSTTTLTVTVTGTNDAPVVLATTANVSEEGLAGGEADTFGTIDTTDAASHSGIINLSDIDGDTLSVTLSAPADSISSAGVPIVWSGSGTQTLIGSAGGVEIMRATVSDDGRYTVTLSGAIDHPATTGEDARSLDFGVNVSDGTDTIQSTLTITVEDDAPQAAQINQTIEVAPIDTNLLLILDTSGSMNTGDGVAGTSRLATAISALNQLLDSYDNFGEVRVRLVTFSDAASSRGSGWMAVSEAKALLAALTPSGGTNYDAALATAQSAFTTPGKLASGQNIAYFLSDGQPSFPQWAVDANEESAWKSFLSTNDITSYALGMGSRTVQSDLNPIAYNGITNTDLDGQVITDFNKLAGALQTTIPPTASGEILSGSLHGTGFGGDGGHVSSITVDGVTYTPDTSLGTLTASGGTSTATYDATTNSIRVLTATSGTLALDFDTGSYTYTPPPSVSTSVINDGFTYVLTDNDGDSASSRVLFTASRMNENTITLSSPQQVSGTSGNDSITGSSGNDSISGGAGNDIIKGGDGDDLIAGGAGHDTLTGGAGADTFKWSLGDAGTAAAPAVDAITDFNTAAASSGGDVLDLRDLLQGESHTGNLAGNLGSYLHFEKIGADTVVNVSSNGGFSGGNYSATDQKLILQGVDLTTLGTDTQIIQNLLANGKLNTD